MKGATGGALTGAAAGLGLAVSVVAVYEGGHLPVGTPAWVIPGMVGLAFVGFALGAGALLRTPIRTAIPLLLVGLVLLVGAASLGPPRSSDDLYRYLWDGRVQAAGVDPYRYAPAAPELTGLRDPALWPESSSWCVADGETDGQTGRPLVAGCTLINRPAVHTIYPPVAELLFLFLRVLGPPGGGYATAQVAGGLFTIATTVLLLFGLRRFGADPRRAVLWAWCPVVPLEAVSNGHIDVAAAFLTAAGLLVLAGARRPQGTVLGGGLLGLAVAVKLTPLAVVPAVLRRRPVLVGLALAAVVALSYAPHVLAVGGSALGYLGGYAQEEGYANGSHLALLPLPGVLAPIAGLVALGVASVVAWRTSRPDAPWLAAALTTGALLLVSAPTYPWYALVLVALVGLGARAEWLALAVAGYVAQYASELALSPLFAQRLGYGLAGAVVLAGWYRRRRWHRRRRPTESTVDPSGGEPATRRARSGSWPPAPQSRGAAGPAAGRPAR